MARKPRFTLPNETQHVVHRGNNRNPCFYSPIDYRRYHDLLVRGSTKYKCAVHAYVLMTNHVHLLITPREYYALSKMMQWVSARYVEYINDTYSRTGTLWEGRYRSSLVESETYLFICHRYIELNPVRAGMVSHPAKYEWSSYHCNAHGKYDELVTAHDQYTNLAAAGDTRHHAYRELFREELESMYLTEITGMINQDLVLGTERFKDEIERLTGRRTRPGTAGQPRHR